MSAVVVLTLIVLGSFAGAPHLLGRGGWRLRRPRLCLTLWYGLFLTGTACSVAAIVSSVVLGVRARTAAQGRAWPGPTADTIAAWIALGLAGAVLSLVGTKAAAMLVAERRLRSDFTRLTQHARCRRERIAGLTVHVLNSDGFVVCALRRRGGELIVSTAVTQRLSAAELYALLEHERAHLRGLHDIATRLAALNAGCLPGFLTPVSMSRTTALLIELIADQDAVRRTCRRDVAGALSKLADLAHDDTMRLRAALLPG